MTGAKKPPKQPLKGHKIVFTGKMMSMLRSEASQHAANLGATIQGTVTGTTTLLVCAGGADNMNTAKYTKAIEKGLQMWSEDDFVELVKNGNFPKQTGKNKFKKPPVESDSDSDTDSSTSSSSSGIFMKKKNKKSPPPKPIHKKYKKDPEDTSCIMFYCDKGGCKLKIAEKFKYQSKSEKIVNDTASTARHINLAPYDVTPPLNAVFEGNLDSPAWTILNGLGINPRYHDSAVLKPLKAKTLGPNSSIWQELNRAKGKDYLILKLSGEGAPSTSPVFYGAVLTDCIVGALQGGQEKDE